MIGASAGAGMAVQGIGDVVSYFGLEERRDSYPIYQALTAQDEQMAAINGNRAALPGAKALAADVNTFNASELQRMLEGGIPGYKDIQKSSSDLIRSELKGEIPADVLRQIQRNGASAAAGSGTSGSEFAANRTLRDLGLTSLDMTQRGITNATNWVKMSAALTTPQFFNLSSMFMSPEFSAQFNAQQKALEYESRLGKWSLPNALEYFGGKLQQRGGQLAGMGGFGGGGGGGDTSSVSSAMPFISGAGGF